MMRNLFPILTVLLLIGQPMTPASAQSAGSAADGELVLLANLREKVGVEPYLANLRSALRRLDSDHNGLDPDDLARAQNRKRAEAQAALDLRRENAARTFAGADGNHDGRISGEEFADWNRGGNDLRSQVEPVFRRADANGDGLLRLDELQRGNSQSAAADIRSMDTDGDGAISLTELLAKVAAQGRSAPPPAQFGKRDRDGNGFLSAEEWADLPGSGGSDERYLRQQRDRLARVVAVDPDRDGHLTEAELAEVVRLGFARFDADGDGMLSGPEYVAASPQLDRAAQLAETPVCPVSLPGPQARAVALALGNGQLLSSVAIGGPDEATSIVDVRIDPGAEPLYVLAYAQDRVIWRLSGATERVERMVLFSNVENGAAESLAATIGLAADKVQFALAGCFSVQATRSDAAFATAMRDATGVTVQARSVPGGVARVRLPALELTRTYSHAPVPEGFDPDEWNEAVGFWPRGVERLFPSALVTHAKVETYQVLPARMGVAQLVAQGVLKPTRNFAEYRIVRPLARFPGGMYGAHSASFVLPARIAMPAGDLGHGCVYDEQGKAIGRSTSCIRVPRGPTLTVRVDRQGKACLHADNGKNVGCFPADGRPLQVSRSGKSVKVAPATPQQGEEPILPAVPVPAAPGYRPLIELIPADGASF